MIPFPLGAWVRPVVPDTNALLMLHCEGSHGGTTFTDSSSYARTITSVNATTSTTQVKFGSTSGYFTSSPVAYLSVSNVELGLLGSGLANPAYKDFTLELFFRPSSLSNVQMLWANDGSSTGDGLEIFVHTAGQITINSGGVNISSATGIVLVNQWNHIAIQCVYNSTFNNNTWSFYVNGTLHTTTSLKLPTVYAAGTAYIGARKNGTLPIINGYVDDYRIKLGTVYTGGTYTVPTSPLLP